MSAVRGRREYRGALSARSLSDGLTKRRPYVVDTNVHIIPQWAALFYKKLGNKSPGNWVRTI